MFQSLLGIDNSVLQIMTNQELLLNKAKVVVLSEIRKRLPGTGNLEISVEAHGEVKYFEQVLQLPEVQHVLRAKNITASLLNL